jgi:hypothetical protein
MSMLMKHLKVLCFLFILSFTSCGCFTSGNFIIQWISDQENITFFVAIPHEHMWSAFAINNASDTMNDAVVFLMQDKHLHVYKAQGASNSLWLGELEYSPSSIIPEIFQMEITFSYPLSVWKGKEYGSIFSTWDTKTKISSPQNFTMQSILKQHKVLISDNGKDNLFI